MNLKTTAEQREEWKSDCEKMCSAGKTEKNLAIYFALVLLEDFESILGKLENSGCMCQGCGDRYALDVIIPDEIWEEIKPYGKPVGAGLLCPNCISSRTVELLEVSKKVREIGQMYCNELKMERDAALARVEELEEELTASQRQAQRLAEKFCAVSTKMSNTANTLGFCQVCNVCSGEEECEGVTCEDVISDWAKGEE